MLIPHRSGSLSTQALHPEAQTSRHHYAAWSWNRNPPSGYQVIAVEVTESGEARGVANPLLTGFLNESGEAKGRPVGVIVNQGGAMLVADDVGDTVWYLTGK